VRIEEVRKHAYVLTPGRFVGSEEIEEDGEDLTQKLERLKQEVRDGFDQRAKLQKQVISSLQSLELSKDA
jgi:type I restriction enzyme M protein